MAGTASDSYTYTFAVVTGANTMTRTGLGIITYKSLASLTLKASLTAVDTINAALDANGAASQEINGGDQAELINAISIGLNLIMTLKGGAGDDLIKVGTPGQLYTTIHGVYVDGGADADTLQVYGTLVTSPPETIGDDATIRTLSGCACPTMTDPSAETP